MINNSFLQIYISFLAEILKVDKFDLDIKPDEKYHIISDCDRKNNHMKLHYCSEDISNDNWIRFVYAIVHEMRHVFQQHLCWYNDINSGGSLNNDDIKQIEQLLPVYDKDSSTLSEYINEMDANAFALFVNVFVFNRKLYIGSCLSHEHFKRV